jgi:16S rRNA C1402 (ribose-2'-O) methylase RsmI
MLGEYYNTRVIQIETVPLGKFSDSDAKEIKVFQELDWLAANDSELTDEGLKHLAALRNLGRLDVERCRVTREGIAELRRALPKTDIYSDFGKD